MACLFISVFSRSSAMFFIKKTLLQLKYFAKTLVGALSNSKALTWTLFQALIWACFLQYIGISFCSQIAMYTTNVLLSASNTAITKFFLLIIQICLVMDKILLMVKVFYISVFSPNDISALLNFKKNISKITLNLVLATKKVFLKKSRPANLIFYLKISNYHSKSLQNRAINLLSSNISFSNLKTQLLSKIGIYGIDFIATIKQSFYLFLLELNWIMNAKHPNNLLITISYWHRGCQD